MDLGLSGLLSGLGNAVSSIFTARENRKAQREANEANMELAKYQNEANVNLWREQNAASIEQWNRNNEYNDPAHQLARYRDAGLNPMLIYGSGSSVAGNSSSPASIGSAPHLERAEMKPVTMPNIPFGDYIGDAATLYIRQKQLEKDLKIGDSQYYDLIASAKAKEAEARNKDSQTRLNILNADITEAQKDALIRVAGLKNDSTEQSIAESKSREALNASNVDKNAMQTRLFESQLGLAPAQAANLMKQIEVAAEKIAGMKLSRRFDELTFNDRQMAIIESVSQAIDKTEQGHLELSMKKIDKLLMDKYGMTGSQLSPVWKTLSNIITDFRRTEW